MLLAFELVLCGGHEWVFVGLMGLIGFMRVGDITWFFTVLLRGNLFHVLFRQLIIDILFLLCLVFVFLSLTAVSFCVSVSVSVSVSMATLWFSLETVLIFIDNLEDVIRPVNKLRLLETDNLHIPASIILTFVTIPKW